MATISSPGIGSGLDVNSIVSQLVAVERVPLTQLQRRGATIQNQLSEFGVVKSQISALSDAATQLATASDWTSLTASSSDSTSVSATITSQTATPTSLSIQTQQLAKAQSVASAPLAADQAVGVGTLVIQPGSWNSAGTQFTPTAGAAPVSINIAQGSNTPAAIAAAINGASAGVTASTITDVSGTRLVITSNATGQAAGFSITASETQGTTPGLERLGFAPGSTGASTQLIQAGADALATINGIAIRSPSNTLDSAIPGVSIALNKLTTGPVTLNVQSDTTAQRKLIDTFVAAYNTLNATLATDTAYDPTSKTGGILQGDSAARSIQSALRAVVRSTTSAGSLSRLLDVGIQQGRDGSLSVDNTKMAAALAQGSDIAKLLSGSGTAGVSDGIAVRMHMLTSSMILAGGTVANRTDALQQSVTRNSNDQQKMTDHISVIQQRLQKQYSSLDATMAKMNALSSYVTQQVTNWSKSSTGA